MIVETVAPVGAGLWWPPCGVGDFADLAWFLAGELGNAPGVTGLEVVRYGDRLHAVISAENAETVELLGTRPGWELWRSDSGYVSASGDVGGVSVRATWMSSGYAQESRRRSDQSATTDGVTSVFRA